MREKSIPECRYYRVSFEPDYVVLLDGYPKVNYGAVQFRFVIVLPPNAVPMDRLRRPLLTKEILSSNLIFFFEHLTSKKNSFF